MIIRLNDSQNMAVCETLDVLHQLVKVARSSEDDKILISNGKHVFDTISKSELRDMIYLLGNIQGEVMVSDPKKETKMKLTFIKGE